MGREERRKAQRNREWKGEGREGTVEKGESDRPVERETESGERNQSQREIGKGRTR